MGCCCDSSVLSGGWSGGVGEGRRVSSGRVKSGGPSAVQTKIGAMVTKDTTVDSSPFVWTKESLARKGRYPFKKIVGAGVSFAPPLSYKSVDQESSLFLTMDSQTSSPVGPAA